MRISDWSSDVCSSDLFRRSGSGIIRLALARCRRAAGRSVRHDRSLRNADGGPHQQAVTRIPQRRLLRSHRLPHVAVEIRIATGREIVCQYGYRSVVAGPLIIDCNKEDAAIEELWIVIRSWEYELREA